MNNNIWVQLLGFFVLMTKVIIVTFLSLSVVDYLLYDFLSIEQVNNFVYWTMYCWFVICMWTFVDNS